MHTNLPLTLSLLSVLAESTSAQSCDGGSVFSTSLCCLGTLLVPSPGPTNPVTSSPWDSPPIIPSDSASRPEPTKIPIPPGMTAELPTKSLSPAELSSVLSSLASVAATEDGTMSILPIDATGASMPYLKPGEPRMSGMRFRRNHGPYSVSRPDDNGNEPNAFGPPGLTHGGQGGVKTGTVDVGAGTTCVGNVITMGTQSQTVTGTGSGTAGATATVTVSSGTQGPSGSEESSAASTAGESSPAATSPTPGAAPMVQSTRWDIVLAVAAVAGAFGLMM